MKKFIIIVPEAKDVKESTKCSQCPWLNNNNVCRYCMLNDLCNIYDFSKAHIEEYD